MTTTEEPAPVPDVDNTLDETEPEVRPTDLPVKQPPELAVTLIPVISVCAIFLGVAVIAVLFRNKIYLVRTKSGKDDMVGL